MFFLYADASGHPKVYPDRDNGFYILSGLIVHEKNWQTIENRLTKLKIGLFPEKDPSSWEVHAYEIWNNINFFEQINLDKKNEIFSSITNLILESEITIISSVMLKEKMRITYVNPKVMEYAWIFLIERYSHFLNNLLDVTNGLVFMDSDQISIETQIKTILSRLVRSGSSWQPIDKVIEDPIFTKSHLRNLIQLSDFVAYCIHKQYQGNVHFKAWFEQLCTKMYQPDGDLYKYGLKVFP